MAKNIRSAAELSPVPAYTLCKEEYLDDIKSLGLIFRHSKSGAKICVLSNDDENKTFCAAFRTTPTDSTGVPHIIEHSVLCGSKNFPSRDPFMQLAKGSLNTFLNAMTYPDKTLYPVASCNDKDFVNLMHVYMDAVFYPNIYTYRQIFEQEGWHYEMTNPEDPLIINGVVYSEMKGAMSNPDSVIFETMTQKLFPDTTYGVNSGGDPDVIPTLTYENFINFHKRYYHPSNCCIFLCGDMDVEERLNWMDSEYLSKFDAIDPKTEVTAQTHFGAKEPRVVTEVYPIGKNESPEGKTYFGYAAACGHSLNVLDCTALDFIGEVLLSTEGAPLKQALIDAGIGSDVYGGLENHIIENMFAIVAKNAKEEDFDRFQQIIRDTLTDIVEKGINEKAILAVLNRSEFRFRESDFGGSPRGLAYAIEMMQSWNYDDDAPFDYLRVLDIYKELREKIGTGYYEDLIRKYFLDGDHSLVLKLTPCPGLDEQRNAELAEKLAAYKASLSDEQIQDIINATAALRAYQSKEPTEEELRCIPVLDRKDIARDAQPLQIEERTIGGVKGVYHDLETNGITYGQLLFKIGEMPKEYLPYIGVLGAVLGKMDTASHTYGELAIDMKLNTGSMYCSPVSYRHYGKDGFIPVFSVNFHVLADKVAYALETAKEILTSTCFDDTKRLREILAETASDKQRRIQNSGHSVSLSRARSYYNTASLYQEIIDGIDFYHFLQDVLKNYDTMGAVVAENLKKTAAYIFNPDNLLVSVAADDAGYAALENGLSAFCDGLNTVCHASLGQGEVLVPEAKNEGLAISSQVTYLAHCGSLTGTGYAYTGAMQVVRTAVSYEYLYQNIRVKGGAYGCGCGFDTEGSVYFYSYRDPKLAETEAVYCGAGEYVRNCDMDEEELNRYIIGTFSSIDRPMSPAGKAERSLTAYMTGKTFADIQREREETLDITVEEFHRIGDIIDAVMPQGYRCAVGNAQKIEENSALFNTVVTVE
ncbi:MAG: insulinase family protein [Clostridia bacterium]|nr:insulinase family protein [Clostridia bacterium]